MPLVEPMLVSSGPLPAGDVLFEVKYDGWRAQLAVDGCSGAIRLVTRSGRRVEEAVPELQPIMRALEGRRALLDGELVAGNGLPTSFYRLGRRLATTGRVAIERARRSTPLTFVAFDLLWLDDVVLLGQSYRERRRRLEGLELDGAHWVTTPVYPDGAALLDVCEELGAEGVVAKRLDRSPYRPGRRSAWWVKRKCPSWQRDHSPRRRPPGELGIPPDLD